jgi:hypothetical protein
MGEVTSLCAPRAHCPVPSKLIGMPTLPLRHRCWLCDRACLTTMRSLQGPSVLRRTTAYAGYGAICVQDLHTVSWVTTRHVIPQQLLLTRLSRFRHGGLLPARAMRRSKFGAQTTFGMLALGAWTSARHLAPDWLPVSSGASVRVLSAVGSSIVHPSRGHGFPGGTWTSCGVSVSDWPPQQQAPAYLKAREHPVTPP